ncbi:MAG TPA: UDP-N-acetylmuramoyl-L-alanine--D-glutamate ligase [Burkholderiaceae bacterium]|nr:UDP-N-acetylmuramoyl-L-alanine--D-glutamate ligase [Burkholderiaceae bacterium]
MNQLQDQTVLILGLGVSGLAMARWCARCGANVRVADTREAPPQLAALLEQLPDAQFISGPLDAALVEGTPVRAVFRSPGLAPALFSPVIDMARSIGLWTGGELDLFAQGLADLKESQGYTPAVLAVTGTNGKTTVTALAGQLVERAGKSVAVAGNIGPSLLDTLAERVDANTLPEVWVLELSSFQLEGVAAFEPTAAAVLNVTQDHLDWHGDMRAYAAAKARIFGAKTLMLLNREDPLVMAMLPPPGRPKAAAAPSGGSEVHAVTSVGASRPPEPLRVKLQKPQLREHVTFGGDMPQRPGDFGVEVVNGMAWLVRALEADETRKRRRRSAGPSQAAAAPSGGSAAHEVASVGAHNFDEEEELHIQRLMPCDALRIRGRHNSVNALAALALALAAGCPLGPMLYGLREYRGEPHRVDPVGIINDVEYFDDSKGTNVGATVAALHGLGADRKLVVILGGDGKGQDFAPLAPPVARFVRAVVLIGRDAPQIRALLESTGVPLQDASSMQEAVALAAERAHAGDAVLMSPACASFDMFENYGHRAQVFREAVAALAEQAGIELEGGA